MKIFGKDLFNFKKEIPEIAMYDFAQHGVARGDQEDIPTMFVYTKEDIEAIKQKAMQSKAKPKKKTKKVNKSEKQGEISFTPKGIYQLKALNDNEFFIKTDPEYIKQQISDLNDKLEFMGANKKTKNIEDKILREFGGVKYGLREIESMIERLKNREKLDQVKEGVDKYPHTTTALIVHVLGLGSLWCKKADEFIPDFPKEAIEAMKEYDAMCLKVNNKKTHFYVIADKKDFEVNVKLNNK
ncbi:MAG: hypothetical protein AABY22_06145 [Nanoarchaeota archaeon]